MRHKAENGCEANVNLTNTAGWFLAFKIQTGAEKYVFVLMCFSWSGDIKTWEDNLSRLQYAFSLFSHAGLPDHTQLLAIRCHVSACKGTTLI